MNHSFVARSLDEIQFWSRIMKEHSLFLSLGFTYEQKQLIDEAYFANQLKELDEGKLTPFRMQSLEEECFLFENYG